MKSPIKWIGGKRREIKYFEKYIPEFDTYVEPFVGGGAVYWHLQPKHAILNDINEHLINFYKTIVKDTEAVNAVLNTYENNKEFYYQVIRKLNNKEYKNDIEKAAIFYYLNKTAFSGTWRLNSKGMFNAAFGSYKNDYFKNIDTIYGKTLEGIEIYSTDFTNIFDSVQQNDKAFMFLDPPYLDCDTLYTANQKFEDIYKYIVYYLTYSKCKVMMVVKSTEYLEKLYKNHIIDRYTVGYRNNARSTKDTEHIIITNY